MALDSLALRISIPASSRRAHPDTAETSPAAAQHYSVSAEKSPTSAVEISNVSDPNDLLAVVATWPEEWQDSFAEREAITGTGATLGPGCAAASETRRPRMSGTLEDRARELFFAAIDIPVERRADFLSERCGGDGRSWEADE